MVSEPVARLHVEVSAEVRRAEQEVARFNQTLQKTASVAQRHTSAAAAGTAAHNKSAAAATQNQRATLALAQAEARLAVAQGNRPRAIAAISSGLAQQTSRTTQVVNAERQLLQIQNQVASSSSRLIGALQSLGIAFGAQQLVQFGIGAIQAANNLERTQATVRALAGSQARYNEVLEIARIGQQRYGGTLEENLRGLGSLVNLSNRSGAALEQLDNVSRRLALIDPVQGIEGANIALKEFLTGTGGEAALSLARRFELPRKAIADLAKEGVSAKDRLAALDRLLAEQGITQEVLSNQTKTTAATYVQLAAAFDNARVTIGALLAEAGKGSAEGLIALFNAISGSATTFEGLEGANKAISELLGTLNPFVDLLGRYNAAVLGGAEGLLNFMGIETRSVDVTRLAKGARDDWARSTKSATTATEGSSEATNEETSKFVENTIKTAEAKQRHDELTEASRLAAIGMLGAGDQAQLLAQKYGIAADQAAFLIRMQQALFNAQALSDQRAGERSGGKARSFEEIDITKRAERAHAQAAAAARQRQVEATESSAQRVRRLKQELDALGKGSKTSAAYIDKHTELIQAERALAAEQEAARKKNERGAKSAASAAQKQLDLVERTTDAYRKQEQAAVSAALAQIDDRRKKREEEQRVRKAQKVLASPTASAAQKAAALDVLEEVPLLQRQRALELAEKQATAGASVINGKVYQSMPGAGGTPSAVPSAGATPSNIAAAPAVPAVPSTAASSLTVVSQLIVDGKVIAEAIMPHIIESMHADFAAVKSGGIKRG